MDIHEQQQKDTFNELGFFGRQELLQRCHATPTLKHMLKLLLTLLSLFYLLVASPAPRQSVTSEKEDHDVSKAVKSRMLKAFGGKRNLDKMEFITYTLSRSAFQENGDTVRTKQLWYVHLQKPLVIRLDIGSGDTTTFSTSFYKPEELNNKAEERAIYEGLLRSRFFNFLYMLTSPEATFVYVKPYTYRNNSVDIIRVSSRQYPQMTLDLFVNTKGEVVTSSSPNPSSGEYVRFADELEYVKVADKITFPLIYRVVQQEQVLAEGLFSDMQINKLSPFWQKKLQTLGIEQ